MFVDVVATRFAPRWAAGLARLLGLTARPIGLSERLGMFPTRDLPLDHAVSIRWNEHQVPYIEAQSDEDLAFALGLVQGHLRGHQIALMRAVSQGRLAELVGPFACEVDHAARILGFDRAAAAIEADMPPATRQWLRRYADGLNHYQSLGLPAPPELRPLGLRPAPWTVRDVLGVGRLLCADYTWLTFLALLPARRRPGFAETWRRVLEAGSGLTVDGAPREPVLEMARRAFSLARAGSNAVAVGARRSRSGSPLVACDPHLGLSLPNIWLLVGLRSPACQVVGFMLAGLPFVCIGRNPDVAWGGTNLRAASSDLYDVATLPPSAITTETTEIRVRWLGTTRRKVRRTPFGPVISDARLLGARNGPPIALRWVGHEPTDEVTPFLRAARARDAAAFRAAFAGYGVPAQTMVFADRHGTMGRLTAATLPVRPPYAGQDFVRDAADPSTHWRGRVDAGQLPSTLGEDLDLIVSANDRPPPAPVPIGFLFDCGDRAQQLRELLSRGGALGPADLEAAFDDTVSPTAQRLAGRLLDELDGLPRRGREEDLQRRLAGWDGSYATDSSGAVAFETLLARLVPLVVDVADRPAVEHSISQWNFLGRHLEAELDRLPPARRRNLFRRALRDAARDAARYPSWGDMHRVRVAHFLADLPLLGAAFVLDDRPSPGSRQTPYKSSHGLVAGRHHTKFGAMARHVSDLADPDANWFVLFGGQDEWLGSPGFADQVELWRRGGKIRMPLRPAAIAAEFPILTVLRPKQGRTDPPPREEADHLALPA
jgi:penicillin amidase